jgi:ribonuclease P protein component
MATFEKNTRTRFGKSERLTNEKIIQSLFSEGKSFSLPPFAVRYIPLSDSAAKHHQILISVSKRNFKRAVDRNRIKRQIREAYRLHKHLIDDLPNKYAIAYIYTLKKMTTTNFIEDKLIACLSRLKTELRV